MRDRHDDLRGGPSGLLVLTSLCLLTLVAVCTAPALGAAYVVRPDGSGDFPTIQAALEAALDGDVVELSDGIFAGDGNRDLTFGGKAITLRSQSDDPTVCVIDCQGNLEEPHRGFHFYLEEGPFTVVRGVTVTRGHSSDC